MNEIFNYENNEHTGGKNEVNEETAVQYILNEQKKLIEFPKDRCRPVEYPISYRLKNAFEVFVRVDGTENYWISNYGRCVNNYRRKGFYEHKQGNCHYTVFEIDIDGSSWKRETSPKELVVDAFLVQYRGRYKIWHKDGDVSNNWYKNLITVTPQDYKDLKSGKITWHDLNYEQEYIEYENKATAAAYKVYNGIRSRCGNTADKEHVGRCYDNVTMCKEWFDDPKAFVKWYFEHYYEVEGESMAVDKDLFNDGSNMYSPETCCLLPQGLNSFIANCKKHYFGDEEENALPMGVQRTRDGYCSEITLSSTGEKIRLSEWSTPEEAFAEYKIMKQADIKLTAARYKDKIPDYIYKKLLTIEVKPY